MISYPRHEKVVDDPEHGCGWMVPSALLGSLPSAKEPFDRHHPASAQGISRILLVLSRFSRDGCVLVWGLLSRDSGFYVLSWGYRLMHRLRGKSRLHGRS